MKREFGKALSNSANLVIPENLPSRSKPYPTSFWMQSQQYIFPETRSGISGISVTVAPLRLDDLIWTVALDFTEPYHIWEAAFSTVCAAYFSLTVGTLLSCRIITNQTSSFTFVGHGRTRFLHDIKIKVGPGADSSKHLRFQKSLDWSPVTHHATVCLWLARLKR